MKRALLPVLLLLSLLLALPAASKMSSFRSEADVMWAIGRSQPGMGEGLRRAYAKTVRREATKNSIDPFTKVAICHNESRWRASLVGGKGKHCIGLGQVCLFNYTFCNDTNFTGAECLRKKEALKNGHYNLTVVSSIIKHNRIFCRKMTGRGALFHRWLAGYQGYNRPGKGIWCGMRKVRGRWRDLPRAEQTKQVMNYRLKLIRLNKRRRR